MFRVQYKFKSVRDGIIAGGFDSEKALCLAGDSDGSIRALEKHSGFVVFELIELSVVSKRLEEKGEKR